MYTIQTSCLKSTRGKNYTKNTMDFKTNMESNNPNKQLVSDNTPIKANPSRNKYRDIDRQIKKNTLPEKPKLQRLGTTIV